MQNYSRLQPLCIYITFCQRCAARRKKKCKNQKSNKRKPFDRIAPRNFTNNFRPMARGEKTRIITTIYKESILPPWIIIMLNQETCRKPIYKLIPQNENIWSDPRNSWHLPKTHPSTHCVLYNECTRYSRKSVLDGSRFFACNRCDFIFHCVHYSWNKIYECESILIMLSVLCSKYSFP